MTARAPKDDDIIQALANESDQKVKMLLLLMLSAIEDIGGKVGCRAAKRRTDQTMVLNAMRPSIMPTMSGSVGGARRMSATCASWPGRKRR